MKHTYQDQINLNIACWGSVILTNLAETKILEIFYLVLSLVALGTLLSTYFRN